MENSFENFVAQFKAQQPVSLAVFFYQAELHLIKQLKDYLQIEQTTERSFFSLVEQAKKIKQKETSKHFWIALLAFNQVNFKPVKNNAQPWLRFVNIIESLQGYSGSQLFDAKNIQVKRQHRLFFAYMLAWEHLRYIAGSEDEYSPSSELLATYSSAHSEEDHVHSDACENNGCSSH
ncbi:hypothetical protein DS885_12720 [Psychromonas sp. B3M02]|uniref:hypothetical protein n=1 Tax=Psychromonas sp. B3M02 TaxID=2267226 RepID=UPI000DEBDE10|nr:hypothetical protein [Psychromonas sp. B3M02]RBW43794.1 hypothetical protein DS885_12720 [Psychromonas sp. B3M02]